MRRITYTVYEKSRRGGEYVRQQVSMVHDGLSESCHLDQRIENDLASDYAGHEDRIRIERRES